MPNDPPSLSGTSSYPSTAATNTQDVHPTPDLSKSEFDNVDRLPSDPNIGDGVPTVLGVVVTLFVFAIIVVLVCIVSRKRDVQDTSSLDTRTSSREERGRANLARRRSDITVTQSDLVVGKRDKPKRRHQPRTSISADAVMERTAFYEGYLFSRSTSQEAREEPGTSRRQDDAASFVQPPGDSFQLRQARQTVSLDKRSHAAV